MKVIKAERLSKIYELGEIGTGTISRDLERWWAKMRGKTDPFLRIGEPDNKSTRGTSNVVWSLKDLDFEIEAGDAVGIIGRNGAGKSTLLKILSRVTAPSLGSVKVKGRIASLLEVGTGFHPELTGRENIYLNGTILGMRKAEIARKFDEIVDFSGVERHIDTPVKRYSSGMYIRLAFAVAAHLESEIMIIDEVLAVGDAEFQKKCLGKMGDISKGEGRTVLFVSHNMAAIRSLCKKGLLLEKGRLKASSDIQSVVSSYEKTASTDRQSSWYNQTDAPGATEAFLSSITVRDSDGLTRSHFLNNEAIFIEFKIQIYADVEHMKAGFDVITDGLEVFRTHQVDARGNHKFKKGEKVCITCTIPPCLFNTGQYLIRPLLSVHNERTLTKVYDTVLGFHISLDTSEIRYHAGLNRRNLPGVIFPILKWAQS